MLWRSPCSVLAAAIGAAVLLGEVKTQMVHLMPTLPAAGTPATDSAADSATSAAATTDSTTAGLPKCSCDCCQVTSRTASQQVSGSALACASLPQLPDHDTDTCPALCSNNDHDNVVTADTEDRIQTKRFCLMNCLPKEESVGGKCRKVTTEEQAALMTEGGNGKDPAALLVPLTTALPGELKDPDAPPEPPQLSDAAALKEAEDKKAAEAAAAAAEKAAGSVKKKEKKKKEKETGAMVAEASGKQAIAAGIEARITEAEASSAQALSFANGDLQAAKSNALVVSAAKAQVAAAEVRAKVYAESAKKAALRAQAELKEIEAIPAKAAALAAEKAKNIVQGEVNQAASNLAIAKARLAGPGLPVPLAEAAVRAAQPYYAIMQKAVAMGNLYAQSAHSLQDQAQTLQEQSRSLASQAVLYQTAGYGDMASKLMAQAKGMLNEAQAKDAQARKDFAIAEGVRKSVPNYQANAAAASARATAIANPAGQPPPAKAFLLQRSSQTRLKVDGARQERNVS